MTSPLFSVIIPTYGRPQFLGEAVASVLAQTCSNFECVIIDDASPVRADGPDDPRVRIVRRDRNGGPPAARNTGIDQARGEYVAFLDDDDVWTPRRLADAIEAHQRAPVAVCWQSTLGATHDRDGGRVLEGMVGDALLESIIPHLGATSIRRDAVPKFDERYKASDDVEWWLRVSQRFPVATSPHVGLLYRVHGGARPKTGAKMRLENGYMLLEEYADWFVRHPRSKAFRLFRMGLYASRTGDRRSALRLLAASFRLDPKARTLAHAGRALFVREPSDSGT